MSEKQERRYKRSRLDDDTIQLCYQLAAEGQYDVVIYNSLGVRTGTWYRWMSEGEKIFEDENYDPDGFSKEMQRLMADLYFYVRKGQAEAEQKAVALIQKSAHGDWKAAAWYLERKYRDRWGRSTADDPSSHTNGKLDEFVEALKGATEMSASEKEAVEREMAESDA